jgi:hypothetical protein
MQATRTEDAREMIKAQKQCFMLEKKLAESEEELADLRQVGVAQCCHQEGTHQPCMFTQYDVADMHADLLASGPAQNNPDALLPHALNACIAAA